MMHYWYNTEMKNGWSNPKYNPMNNNKPFPSLDSVIAHIAAMEGNNSYHKIHNFDSEVIEVKKYADYDLDLIAKNGLRFKMY